MLSGEGVDETRARLAARLAGGNLGRARRLATADDGLRFREAAAHAVSLAAEGPTGALEAADVVLAAAAEYKKGLKAELETALAPFVDEKGRPEDAYRGAIKRIEITVPAARAAGRARLRRLGAACGVVAPARPDRGRHRRRAPSSS